MLLLERVLAVLAAMVPTKEGEDAFSRVVGSDWTRGYGTTCGHWVMFYLAMLGVAARRLNRTAEGGRYVPGLNMQRVRELGDAAGWADEPRPGFVFLAGRERPRGSDWGNHVGVVECVPEPSLLVSLDGGQAEGSRQAMKRCSRKLVRLGGGKFLLDFRGELRVVRFFDPTALLDVSVKGVGDDFYDY